MDPAERARYTIRILTQALGVVTNSGPKAEGPGRSLPGRGGEHPRRARGVLPGAGARRRRAEDPGGAGQRGQRRTQLDARVTATAPESGPDAGGTCPHCGEHVDAGASFCEACGKPLDAAGGTDGPSAPADAAQENGPDGRPRQRPDQCLGPPPAHGGAAAAGATCLSELRRRGRVGRLLRVVRGQGAQRARPLPRAARVVGGGRVRQGHPAHPQRGRDGAAGVGERPVAGRCWWSSTGSRTPTTPRPARSPARRPRSRCCGRRSPAGWAPPRAAGPRSPRSSRRAPRAPTTRWRARPWRGRPSPPRRRTSWRCSRAARSATPTSATRVPTGCPTARRGCS